MFDHGREGEFGGGHSVGAGLAGQVNRGCEADRGVFGVISPSLTRRIVLDFRRFKGDGRVAGSLQAFGPFLADAQTPSRIIPRARRRIGKCFDCGEEEQLREWARDSASWLWQAPAPMQQSSRLRPKVTRLKKSGSRSQGMRLDESSAQRIPRGSRHAQMAIAHEW